MIVAAQVKNTAATDLNLTKICNLFSLSIANTLITGTNLGPTP
jgi:hypothetical protein